MIFVLFVNENVFVISNYSFCTNQLHICGKYFDKTNIKVTEHLLRK